jgi:hypothetical protein
MRFDMANPKPVPSFSRAWARAAGGKARLPMDDDRIEAFIRDVLSLEGENSNMIREGVRRHLAVYEKQFRDEERDVRKKDEAAQRCRKLCRDRIAEETEQCDGTPTTAHLEFVLSVIDDPARFPLKD